MTTETFYGEGRYKSLVDYKMAVDAYQAFGEKIEESLPAEDKKFMRGLEKAVEDLLLFTEKGSYGEGFKKGIKTILDLE